MLRNFLLGWFVCFCSVVSSHGDEVLPNTTPLAMEGDIAAHLVAGLDRFLLNKLEQAIEQRPQHWQRDFNSPEKYIESVAPNRARLAKMLGVRDQRVPFDAPELIAEYGKSALPMKTSLCEIFTVRWPVLEDPAPLNTAVSITAEGLLIEPREGKPPLGYVVAIPDADQTPEQLAGLAPGLPEAQQSARILASAGYRVLVPSLVSRRVEKRQGRAELTDREFLQRSAYELGRHMIGYEVQKILSAVDWFALSKPKGGVIGVIGQGEGALLALYAAALDSRIDVCGVGGYFASRQTMWQEPLDRNVFGLLAEFGDAEIASLIFPRRLVVGRAGGIEFVFPSGKGGAPGELHSITKEMHRQEVERARNLLKPFSEKWLLDAEEALLNEAIDYDPRTDALAKLFGIVLPAEPRLLPKLYQPLLSAIGPLPERHARQVAEIDRHNQRLLAESAYTRAEFMRGLDVSSLEKFNHAVEKYRETFAKEIIGQFDDQLLPPQPRSRQKYDQEKWTGYEVVLDVFPEVIAYGILLVPKNIPANERRPVIVCQHGLEGRPTDTIAGNHAAYHDYAAKLAEQGFVVFAPQNPYIFGDRFRTLQRKANPLGKTLFSLIVPQHEQITRWLKTLPYVDDERIAFYGLSYGGKSAMRIPPLVKNYCLSICSADFNEWVDKNASSRAPYSYVWTGEYEIFEFDLGSTFNYAEMAALIAPRPFMVERGHFDGVGTDEMVSHEFAKVRHLYAAKLGLADRCEIEYFVGPHTIHGRGTFDFLQRHLRFPVKP